MKILIAVLVAAAVVAGAIALTMLRQRDAEQSQLADETTTILGATEIIQFDPLPTE